LILCWFLGSLTVIMFLFSIGEIIFHRYGSGFGFLLLAIISGVLVFFFLSKSKWEKEI